MFKVQSKGVDSMGSGFADPKDMLKQLARKERKALCCRLAVLALFSDWPYLIPLGCIIAMTGKVDWVTDGFTTVSLHNGHKLLGSITGSGCIVGTSIAAFCAAVNIEARSKDENASANDQGRLLSSHMLIGAIAGYVMAMKALGLSLIWLPRIMAITIASELAAARDDVKGTGTFLPALIDELYNLTPDKIRDRARVYMHS